jgi:hypothetical protein
MGAKKTGRGAKAVGRRGRKFGDPEAIKVTVTVDPKRKKAWEAAMLRLEAARASQATGFDDYWEVVGDIVDAELYVAGGHETPEAFYKAVVGHKKRTAQRMVRVARHATEQEIKDYTVSLLDAAISYVEAKAGGPTVGKLPIRFEAIRVPVKRDGKEVRVGLLDAGVVAVRAATKAVLKKSGSSRERVSPAAAEIADVLGAIASLKDVTVSVVDGKLKLGNIPLAAIGVLGRALDGITLDSPGATSPKGKAKGRAKK